MNDKLKKFNVTWIEHRQVEYNTDVMAFSPEEASKIIKEDIDETRTSEEKIQSDELDIGGIEICEVEEIE